MTRFPVGVQAYTVRRELERDYAGTIEQLAAIGFQGIELTVPQPGMSTGQLRALLDRVGLPCIGTHAPFDSLDFDVPATCDALLEAGGRYLSVSLRFASRAELLDKVRGLNRVGEACAARGVTFLYHNHDWEFVRFDGEYALDLLIRETDPALVQLELDTYWVKRGGADPAEYLAALPGRCPLLHVKDMEAGDGQFFAEVGEGVLDFPGIAAAAAGAGTRWLIVEQDETRRLPLESLAISHANLQRLGLAGRSGRPG